MQNTINGYQAIANGLESGLSELDAGNFPVNMFGKISALVDMVAARYGFRSLDAQTIENELMEYLDTKDIYLTEIVQTGQGISTVVPAGIIPGLADYLTRRAINFS